MLTMPLEDDIQNSRRPFKAFLQDTVELGKLKSDLLSADGPIDCEIGCGVGWHPIQYSKNHPDRYLLAIEHTARKFKSFENRLARHRRPNLFACHGNAMSVIPSVLASQSIDRFFILYPNPNPKEKGANLRWHRMPFMACILDKLKQGGTLQMVSNEEWYWLEARSYLIKQWGFVIREEKKVNLDSYPNWKFRSHFEKKYLERGQTIYDLIVQKKDA